jgi:hypothetical protein
VRVWDAYQAGEFKLAREIYCKLFVCLNCESYFRGAREYVMKRRGVFTTTISRQHDTTVSSEAVGEIDFYFEGLKPYLKA